MSMHHALPLALQSSALEGMTVVSGAVVYTTSNPPGPWATHSAAITNDILRIPFEIDGVITAVPTTIYEFSIRSLVTVNNTNNDLVRLGTGLAGVEGISLSYQDNTGLVTLYVAGVLRATSAQAFSVAEWHLLQARVDHQSGGTVSVAFAGDRANPIMSYVLTAGDITALGGLPDEWYLRGHTNGHQVSSAVLLAVDATFPVDFSELLNPRVRAVVVTGDDLTGWTGSFSDIDELPPSDSDFIRATATGQVSRSSISLNPKRPPR